MKRKVAIIDNGVDQAKLRQKVKEFICIDKEGKWHEDICTRELNVDSHGTKCALILESLECECILYSIKVLDDEGIGTILQWERALKWCYENEIFIVNLSLGTTCFSDRIRIQKIINYYVNKGMIIVAALSNDGYRTYPAAFSNVIGVRAGKQLQPVQRHYRLAGAELYAPIQSDIVMNNGNSFAAPYVTALIIEFFKKNRKNSSICEIRQYLYHLCEKDKKERMILEPDWISNAWIKGIEKKSQADYYFQWNAKQKDSDIMEADTIIINTAQELKRYLYMDKHILYLGDEDVERENIRNVFFWSSNEKREEILKTTSRKGEIEIPIYLFIIDPEDDLLWWMQKLKERFSMHGYNLFTGTTVKESILYDLEYIPFEMLKNDRIEKSKDYLYWKTYYIQADAILIGVNETKEIEKFEDTVDVTILCRNLNGIFNLEIFFEGKIVNRFCMTDQYQELVRLYEAMKSVFTEGIG